MKKLTERSILIVAIIGTVTLVGSCAKMDMAAGKSEPSAVAAPMPRQQAAKADKSVDLLEAAEEPPAEPEPELAASKPYAAKAPPKLKAKPKPMRMRAKQVDPEERKRNARKVIAKKSIAGAFMASGKATKLFASGEGEGGGGVAADAFGDDEDDEGEGKDLGGEQGVKNHDLREQDKKELKLDNAVAEMRLEKVKMPRRRGFKRAKTKGKRGPRGGQLGRLARRPDNSLRDHTKTALALPGSPPPPPIEKPKPRPKRFLPRMCYFENTYLGGNAAYLERLRRLDKAFAPNDRVYRQARASVPDLTPPPTRGLAISATLSRRSLAEPGRVFLQVGIAGSSRYGWRRPPLDIVAVVDPSLFSTREAVTGALRHLASRLGGQDRLGVIVAGPTPRVVVEPVSARELRFALARKLDTVGASQARGGQLARAMDHAAKVFEKLTGNVHRVPGSQVTLLLVGASHASQTVGHAQAAAHRLTLNGVTTSVFSARRGDTENPWWRVANAGHGSLRQFGSDNATAVVDAELEGLSRTVARLIRVNIRLGKHAHAIRVVGAKVLNQQQVKRVKAREKVMDRKIAATMGVKADRGDDDDGIQTVIPYFLGGDRHAIFVELWLDKPGHVADVELKYKDLVNTGNAKAAVAVTLPHFGRPETDAHFEVVASANRAALATVLKRIGTMVQYNDRYAARNALKREVRRHPDPATRAMLERFRTMLNRGVNNSDLRSALEVAAWRQVGEAAPRESMRR